MRAKPVSAARDVEILIAGGGLSALAFAAAVDAAFVESGLHPPRMTIAEPRSMPPAKAGRPAGDVPSLALNRRTVGLLRRWGVWPRTEVAHAALISGLEVGEVGGGFVSLAAATMGWEDLGAVVEAPWLMERLREHLGDRVEWLASMPVEAARPTPEGFEVALGGGAKSTSALVSLLVAADGIDSPLRAMLGVECVQRQCDTQALLINVELAAANWQQGWAQQRYLADGALALLPLPASEHARMLLVRTASASRIEELLQLSASALLKALNAELADARLPLRASGQRRRRALRLSRAAEQWRRGAVLIGDAAHALHPGAAQGFNLTVRDTWALALRLAQARREGESLGSSAVLGAWARERESEQDMVIDLSDWLPRLFSIPGRRVRALGMAALRLARPLRSEFTRRAAGF